MANMLRRLAGRQRTAVLLISRDLYAVAAIADRVAVMYAGRVVETGPAADILRWPAHPYTRTLLASMPGAGPPLARLPAVQGEMPAPNARPSGCLFHPRCPGVAARCRNETPALTATAPACFFPLLPPNVAHG
jgi:oligopeptide/dipeptide ABC transporter ATP-binding protein